jgi:hypothetical protein
MLQNRQAAATHRFGTLPYLIVPFVVTTSLSACFEGGLVVPRDSSSLIGQSTDQANSGTTTTQNMAIELHGIEPSSGSALGGIHIKLTGRNFRQSTVILVDGKTCASSEYINPREITCRIRPHAAGPVNIEVRNLRTVVDGLNGVIQAELKQAFTYLDAQAPAVLSAGVGGGRSKNSGGSLILEARIGEIGAAAVGNTQGEATGGGIILRAGSTNTGASP